MNVPQQKHIRPVWRSRLLSMMLLAALILGVVGPPGAQAARARSGMMRPLAALGHDTLTFNTGENNPNGTLVDSANGFAYVGIQSSPYPIVKVRLSDFTEVGTLTTGRGPFHVALLDPAAGYAYFAQSNSIPGIVVKVRLSDFSKVGELVFDNSEAQISSGVIDTAGGFAYFGTGPNPGKIVKVQLSDFTKVGTLTLNTGENYLMSSVIDPAAGFAYFGGTSRPVGTPPGVVVKVDLPTFTRVGALTLDEGESQLRSAAIDAAAGFAYFGANTSPGKIVKVRLSDFTRVNALTLKTGQNNPTSAVMALAQGAAFFGMNTTPGGLVKVDLAAFSLANCAALNTGEGALLSGDIDAPNNYAYFGAAGSPGKVIRVPTNSAPNNAPVAVDDNYSTDQDAPLTIAAPGVLNNDTDADGDSLTAAKVSDPANGTLTLNADGSFTYTPNAGFSGGDSFTYTADDCPSSSNVATVTITVNAAPNAAPVAVDDSYSTDVNTPLTVADPGVLTNDTDADLDLLTAVKVTDPAHGAVTLNAEGGFTYTPTTDYYGSDSFTYKANDGTTDSNVATVTIDVQAPVGDAGLLGYWKFDDGSGTTALDSSDYHNNGALSAGATWSTNAAPITIYANPGAISLNGTTTGIVTVPNSAINKLTNNFTVMGWVKPNSVSGTQRMISSARTLGHNGWGFGLYGNALRLTTYGRKDYTSPSAGLAVGDWHHIAAVMDSSNTVKFYIDGLPLGSVTFTSPGIADSDDALLIGATMTPGSSTPTDLFNGLVDDVQVYNRALSDADIADLVGVAPCSEPVFRTRVALGELSGTIALDGACTYTLTSAGNSLNGGSGVYISNATTLEGNGAIIERSSGAPQFRIMTINPASTIRNLTLRGGNVPFSGGALLSFGDLTLSNVRFENNSTDNSTGTYAGGAVYAIGNLTADRSTFLGNQSGWGGAVWFAGTTGRITNSVFADNLSSAPGAAIWSNNASGTLTLLNNTFSDQYKNDREALIFNGAATVKNNIFENYKSGLTASGASAVVTEDYNLFAALDGDPLALSGGTVTSGGHDRIAASPRFVNPAARNYHLQANSPAIDLGVNAGVATDADGNARPYGPTVDIGAYEYQGAGIPSVSITKVGPPYAAASGQTEFVLTVINEGTASLDDLRIVDTLPVGATYVAGSASNGGTLSGGTLTWDLSPLAPNQSTRVWYRVTATQNLVSNNYTVSSIGNPAITANGPTLTTPYDANYTALGFIPFPNGYGFANWGAPTLDSDITVTDMPNIYGPGVCKTQSPCVLSAAAEAERQVLAAKSSGGHCGGMAMSSMWIYDTDVNPATYQPGALNTFDLTKANARNLITYFHSTQSSTPADTIGLAPYTAASGAYDVVNTLLANFADPNAATRYTLWFFWSRDGEVVGHAVVPTGVKKVDDTHYWIYVYDVNYPNNFDRVFKVTLESATTWDWVYAGAAANPEAPASAAAGNQTKPGDFTLKSLRWAERFPKACTSACAPDAPGAFNKISPANGTTTTTATSAAVSWDASAGATTYHFCYDTTNDNACSPWYVGGAGTSRTFTGLTPNTTYYWQIRALNGSSPYTYANGSATAFWSFKTAASTTAAASWDSAPLSAAFAQAQAAAQLAADAPVSSYDFQLEGEGSLMITRSDGLRAGIDPATGQFIAEIPGAEQILNPNGLLDFPGTIHIPHVAGMTYTLRVADVKNAYGNQSATADINILGEGYVTRLKGLKIDSPADPEAPAGSNDVVGVTFDGDSRQLTFTSSALDSDTPSLLMAISQLDGPDFAFEIGGAQMPSGHSLSVGFDLATGKLTVTNDDPASNDYTYDVERINMDGSKTSYSGTASDGTGQGATFDLGPSWTGGAPTIEQVNTTLSLETTTPTFCILDNATIDLKLADVVGLYGYQVDVTYDSSKVYAAGALDNGWFDTTTDAFVPGGYDGTCAGGLCRFGASKVAPATPLNGSGRLGVITLAGHTAGTFNLTVTSSILSDIDGMPLTHDVVNLPLTVCDLATVSGKVTMQGRATPINTGTVTLTDPTGTYGPYTVDFSAADGTWTITGVRAAASGTSYKVKADHGLYLFNEKDLTVQPSTTYADQNTRLWGGDANNDESVTIGDLACIGGAFGSWASCDGAGGSDINADGTTNIQDLSIAGGNYTKTSPQPW